jgi:hypothetical protein
LNSIFEIAILRLSISPSVWALNFRHFQNYNRQILDSYRSLIKNQWHVWFFWSIKLPNTIFFHRLSAPNYDSVLIFETYSWKFPGISYFSDLRQARCARKIPEPVLEATLITKGTTYIFLEALNWGLSQNPDVLGKNLWIKVEFSLRKENDLFFVGLCYL